MCLSNRPITFEVYVQCIISLASYLQLTVKYNQNASLDIFYVMVAQTFCQRIVSYKLIILYRMRFNRIKYKDTNFIFDHSYILNYCFIICIFPYSDFSFARSHSNRSMLNSFRSGYPT